MASVGTDFQNRQRHSWGQFLKKSFWNQFAVLQLGDLLKISQYLSEWCIYCQMAESSHCTTAGALFQGHLTHARYVSRKVAALPITPPYVRRLFTCIHRFVSLVLDSMELQSIIAIQPLVLTSTWGCTNCTVHGPASTTQQPWMDIRITNLRVKSRDHTIQQIPIVGSLLDLT